MISTLGILFAARSELILYQPSLNSEQERKKYFESMSMKNPIFYLTKGSKLRYSAFKGFTAFSHVIISLSKKSGKKQINDCYQFAIDTCTTYHICKEKELFVGSIRSSKNLFVQGVGGKIQVKGYGTIKVRIQDDDGQTHDIQIHDVLYVPDSPTNLISPQQWSKSCDNPAGTGEITVGDSTGTIESFQS